MLSFFTHFSAVFFLNMTQGFRLQTHPYKAQENTTHCFLQCFLSTIACCTTQLMYIAQTVPCESIHLSEMFQCMLSYYIKYI